jgi:UDP-glucose 4-epimerase
MELKGKRILLTGSEGFVGKNLAQELRRQGAKVLTLIDRDGQRIDIRDWPKIREIRNLDMVYHLAATTGIPFSFENPRETYEVNILGTLNILELCRLRSIKRVVFASAYVYGNPQYLPIDEKHPPRPANPYARSKVLAEDLCRTYCEDYGLECIVLRAFNIYGKGQIDSFLIPSILKQLVNGKIELLDPAPRRDFLNIIDAVNAYIKAGEYDGAGFEIFNIGSGVSHRVSDVVDLILKVSGTKCSVVYKNERRKNEVMDTVADISKAKRLLKWEPSIALKDGLKNMIPDNI